MKFLGIVVLILSISSPVSAQSSGLGESPATDGAVSISPAIPVQENAESLMEITAVDKVRKQIDRGDLVDIGSNYDDLYSKKSGYVTTFDIWKLINDSDRSPDDADRTYVIMFGIKRPYYRLGADMRLKGTVDLRMGKRLAGLENVAMLTFGYDFRKRQKEESITMDLSILKISYLVVIPVEFH